MSETFLAKSLLTKLYYAVAPKVAGPFFLNRGRAGCAALIYHRIVADKQTQLSDYTGNSVTICAFEEQMKLLSQDFLPISIDEYRKNQRSFYKKTPVIVTFDDGYLDNLTNAVPILTKYSIPAVFYLSTKFLEGEKFLWWYELLNLVKSEDGVKNKRISFKKHVRTLVNLKLNDQKKYIKELSDKISVKTNNPNLDIMMTWSDVKTIAKQSLFTIAAHSHSHTNLTILSDNELYEEFITCNELIKKNTGVKVRHFSAPYGIFSGREVSMAKKSGMETFATVSCKTIGDSFFLQRHIISDYHTGVKLKFKLSGLNSMLGLQI